MTMRMVDAMVKRSDHQLSDSATVLQKILVAAADESGQWQLPLPEEKIEAMRKVSGGIFSLINCIAVLPAS